MKILSVDLAARASGFALFDNGELISHGTIIIPKLDSHHQWMWDLYEDFCDSLPWDDVEHVVVEFDQNIAAYSKMNVKSKRRMYSAMDVLILAKHAMSDAELHEVKPRSWQKAMLSGFPGSTKDASVAVARSIWPSEAWTEHDADAALMGEWWRKDRQWES